MFPETTKEMFSFLKEHEERNYKIEIVSSDENFKEIELHDAIFYIASLLIEAASAIVLNLLSSYIFNKIKSSGKDPNNVGVKVNVFYQKTKDKKTTKIKYQGPASEMHDTIVDVIKEIEKNDDWRYQVHFKK